jgi:N-acetylglucosamine-6-phosphate deacetylase
MRNQQLKIYNGKIIAPDRIIPNGTLLVNDNIITAISEKDIQAEGAIEINANQQYISPGFIDIHVHGGGGHDFMDGTVTAFLEVAILHAKYGTTAMMPTTLTSSKDELYHILDLYEAADEQNLAGAQFIGMHLEGPYIAQSQRGAQDPRYIRDPDPKEYTDILARYPFIKRWSAAPELNGAIALGKYLQSKNTLAAIAHTDAVYEEVCEAFENGYTHATHFYSAMSGVSRRNGFRYAGVIESAYLIDEMTVEIIADGMHLPAPLLKLVYKIKGPQRTALITDAMRAAGMLSGESILGSLHNGIKVIVEDGVAKLPDRSSFAGSVATADRLVHNMISLAGVPLHEAVKMMSATPAAIMGIGNKKGSLSPGKDADILIFDEEINIDATIINGKTVYKK